jgi:hypothetical protein
MYMYVCIRRYLYALRVKKNNLAKRGQGGANTLFCVLYYGG